METYYRKPEELKMKTYYKKTDEPKMMFWCADPISLDKSTSWGEGNKQEHLKGCWVQINDKDTVAHLVAGDEHNPVGWTSHNPFEGLMPDEWSSNLWTKNPIKAEQVGINPVELDTLDGPMEYANPNNDGWVLWNLEEDGEVDVKDTWFMPNTDFTKVYETR
jgi:hypothetical protein